MRSAASNTPPVQRGPRARGVLRRILRVAAWLLLLPLSLLALVGLLIYLPPVQDALRGKAVGFLQERIGTPVQLGHVALRFPIGVALEGLFIQDQAGDTLLYAGSLRTRVAATALLGRRIVLGSVDLADVRATIRQDRDSVFNFQYIIDAFAGDTVPEARSDTTGGWDFSIGGVTLERAALDLALDPSQLRMALWLDELDLEVDAFQAAPLLVHVDDLLLKGTRVDLRMASGPPEPDTYPDLVPPLAGMDIRFQSIALEDVRFTWKDITRGDSLWVEVPEGEVVADDMDLARQRLALDAFRLEGPTFGMVSASPASDTVPRTDPPWLDRGDGFRYVVRDWDVQADEVEIADAHLALHTLGTGPARRLFDPDHLVVDRLQLDASGVVYRNDRMAARELEAEADMPAAGADHRLVFAGSLDATTAAIALRNGRAELDGNVVEAEAFAFPGDLSRAYRCPGEVPLRITASSTVDPTRWGPVVDALGMDLPLKDLDERFDLHVLLSGSAARLDTARIDASGDRGSRLLAFARGTDLSAWPQADFDLDVDAVELGHGLRRLMQAYLPPDAVAPQRLSAAVHAQGRKGSMKAELDVRSDLGDVKGTAGISGWTARIPDAVDADLVLRNVQASRFTGDTALGIVDLELKAEGQALNSNVREGRLSLRPSTLVWNGQDLSSLRVDGTVYGDSIRVQAASAAEALRFGLDARGTWPEAGDSLAAELIVRMDRLALKDLGLTPHVLDIDGPLRGRVALDSAGHGRASLVGDSLRLSNPQRSFRFKELRAQGLVAQDSVAAEVDSDALTLDYHTNIAADSLLPRTREKLLSFFRADSGFVPAPGKHMDLDITLPRSDVLTGLVVPDLQAITLRSFTGRYDSDTDELRLDVDVPELLYDSIRVEGLTANVSATGRELTARVAVRRVDRDSLYVEGLSVTSTTEPGALLTTLRVQHEGEDPRYQADVRLTRTSGVPEVHVVEGLTLDGVPWTADPRNLLRFLDDGVTAEHFTLSAEDQQVSVITDAARTRIGLERLRMGTLLSIVSTADSTPFMGGLLSGRVDLPRHQAPGLQGEMQVAGLEVLGHPLGDLALDVREEAAERYAATVKITNGPNALDGRADIDASAADARVHADVRMAFTDIAFLQPFARSFLYELRGGLNGDLDLTLEQGRSALDGAITFQDARIGISATRSLLRLSDETVRFDRKGIHLHGLTVRDSLDNTFTLDGDIRMEGLGSPRFDLDLRTDRFQFARSRAGDNDLFYGDVFAGLDLHLSGTDRVPALKGDVHLLEGTDLSVVLPGSKVELVGSEGIVIFTSDLHGDDSTSTATDGERLRDSLAAQLRGFDLDLLIGVDPKAEFAIVLDPTTGDQATFQGHGDLHFRYGPQGDMWLSGPFTLDEGGYTLEFYGLVKKRFELVKGSTITWSGDVLKARMDIKARYRSESAPYPLVAGTTGLSEDQRNRLQAQLPFEVIIDIGGEVDKPSIDFGIDLERSYRNSYPQVSSRLDELAQSSSTEERNKQVFGLLVLNSFIQDEGSGGAPSSGIATSAARSSVNGILTEQMNKLTGRYIKGVDISLGVNTYDQAAGSSVYQRTSVDYKVSKSFLNERLSFEVGGSVGVDEQQQNVSNVSNTRAAQYVIYYDLTRDGRFRLRGFYENAFDLYDGEITDSGIALMYTKQFEENEVARERAREAERERRRKEQEERRRNERPHDEAAPARNEDE